MRLDDHDSRGPVFFEYTDSKVVAADIYTKGFIDRERLEHACVLINVIGPSKFVEHMQKGKYLPPPRIKPNTHDDDEDVDAAVCLVEGGQSTSTDLGASPEVAIGVRSDVALENMNKRLFVEIVVSLPGESPTVITHTATGLIWRSFLEVNFVCAGEIFTLAIEICLWVVM
jgi:hypothetical protein